MHVLSIIIPVILFDILFIIFLHNIIDNTYKSLIQSTLKLYHKKTKNILLLSKIFNWSLINLLFLLLLFALKNLNRLQLVRRIAKFKIGTPKALKKIT